MGDVRLLFESLSGSEVFDPTGTPFQPPNIQREDLRAKPIAVLEDDGLVPVSEETRLAVRSAAQALKARGFRVEPFRSQTLEAARKLWWIFFIRCGRMLLEPMVRGKEEELSSTFDYFLKVARAEPLLRAEELLAAWMEWDIVRATLLEELAPYAAIVTPVCSIPAFRHGEREWLVEGETLEYFSAMRFTQWFNLLGAPAAVVPVSRSAEGLPIGVQIAGRPYQDEVVLAVAELLDDDFGYMPPPIATSGSPLHGN